MFACVSVCTPMYYGPLHILTYYIFFMTSNLIMYTITFLSLQNRHSYTDRYFHRYASVNHYYPVSMQHRLCLVCRVRITQNTDTFDIPIIFQVCIKTLDTIDVCLHTTGIYSIQVSILVLDSTDIFLYTYDFTVNVILMTFCCFSLKL